MFARGPLLEAQQGQDGSFPRWLEDLGLKDFLSRYPLRRLVDWGWVVPQYRVIFPKDFIISWKIFPCMGEDVAPEFHTYSLLWDSTWEIENTNEPLWFLHPFFNPDDEVRKYLSEHGKSMLGEPIPEEFTHPNGHKVVPYADYFYRWQGFALIDVIRFADCIASILNTPDVEERAAGIVRVAQRVKQSDPRDVLTIERRWGGLAQLMTWLSHYRAFRDAIPWYGRTRAEIRQIRRDGAKQLADYLGFSSEILSSAIKDRFLVLAQDWYRANDRYCSWTLRAWPYLQQDIAMAVEWLCYLTGKTLDYFLDEWSYRDYFGQRKWAELHTVLPHEFFIDRKQFFLLVPHYLKSYNSLLPVTEQLEGERLIALVDRLRSTNYPFGSFLGAFRQLHDELGHRYDKKGELDFRELRPLDYYSLLAIRAEQVLRYAIDQDEQAVAKKLDNLREYIAHFAAKQGLPQRAIEYFCSQDKDLTRLHDVPQDPIGRIMALTPGFRPREDYLVKAFLSCTLARNYFAHHHYLDGQDLPQSEKSAFMLSGILVTVLSLL